MRTNSANYGREPRTQCEPESANFLCNYKRPIYVLVYTQCRNDFHNDSKRKKKPTLKYCLVLQATYMEIFKNSIGLSRSKGLSVCGTLRLSALGYRVYLTLHNVASCKLMKLGLYVCQREDTSLRAYRRTLQIEWTTAFTLVP